ncbi:hypothetical protein LMG28138_05762 [Pararobbsia alpina]|uniref:Uncharacterized protein n=1 Tax=Pararobbsia alpina TaxID=621374 RepID=A0A6S7BWM9_9BURK|nr:hypothetical protein LMG28138_05762 [Pararobbsia alpina]
MRIIGATWLLGKETAGLLSRDHEVVGASRKRPAPKVDISDPEVRGGRHHGQVVLAAR